MKLYQECQANFAILGINSNQRTRFNGKLMIAYSVYSSGLISGISFFFFEACTFQEYSNNAYVITSMIICLSTFTNIVFKTDALFQFVGDLAELFEKSEYNLAGIHISRWKSNGNCFFFQNLRIQHRRQAMRNFVSSSRNVLWLDFL